MRNALRKVGLLEAFEVTQALARYALRRAHEPDFAYFRKLKAGPGLFVDIGANLGQSAFSFAVVNRDYHILSFEPNRLLESRLKVVRRVLGARFEYQLFGLSDRTSSTTYYWPVCDGFSFLQEMTSDRNVLLQPQTRERMRSVTGRDGFEIAEQVFENKRFDDLGLAPDIVKIDVQGAELTVLQGMRETLEQHRPLLLVEAEYGQQQLIHWMRERRYEPRVYDSEREVLRQCEANESPLNLFFISS